MAHQGGKIADSIETNKMYDWLDKLEFDLMELPKPDLTIFLHMPTEVAEKLKEKRTEKADEHEKDKHHLKNAERAYLELADKYNFVTVECFKKENPKAIEEINDIVYKIVKPILNKRS